jgi:hypothetical protein
MSATRFVFPSLIGQVSPAYSEVTQGVVVTAAPYTFSLWLRGNVGGERIWLNTTTDAVTWYRTSCSLTTTWQRFTLTVPTASAATWYFQFGVDLRDASETPQPAQTVYAWGTQVEPGAFATSLIATTTAPVARAQDLTSMATAPWIVPATSSWFAEFILLGIPTNVVIVGANATNAHTPLVAIAPNQIGSYDGALVLAGGTISAATIVKAASTFGAATGKACLNGGSVTSGAQTGFSMATIGFIEIVSGASANNGSGYMRRVQYWPRVLSNAEMQQVTT